MSKWIDAKIEVPIFYKNIQFVTKDGIIRKGYYEPPFSIEGNNNYSTADGKYCFNEGCIIKWRYYDFWLDIILNWFKYISNFIYKLFSNK